MNSLETQRAEPTKQLDSITPYLVNSRDSKINHIKISDLNPMKNQPRQFFEEETLKELADSILVHGIIQPLIVSQNERGVLTIIAGERRWRAAKLAGLTEIPCIIRTMSSQKEMEVALIENIQREQLSAIDEATAIQRLIAEHCYSQEGVAIKLGKNRTTISNAIRLLSLPPQIISDLQEKSLSAGHARALCALNSESEILTLRKIILSKKMSVRQTEDLVQNFKGQKSKPNKQLTDNLSPDLRYLCDQFKGHLGTKVKITGKPELGKIEISYFSAEDLERLTELILTEQINVTKNR